MADGKFEKYSKLYPDIQLERHSGLLEVTFGVGRNFGLDPKHSLPGRQPFQRHFNRFP